MAPDPLVDVPEPVAVSEHSLAALHGLGALVIGAFAWSGAAAVLGPWSLPAAPALGWMVAWSCRYGGCRTSSGVRVIAWLLSTGSVLVALATLATFSAFQGSPDASLDARAVVAGCWSLFAAPPWFGSLSVLLALPGTARALRGADTARERAAAPEVVPLPASVVRTSDPGVEAPGMLASTAPRTRVA